MRDPARLRGTLWGALSRPLPEGGRLPRPAWQRRHARLTWLLAGHVALLPPLTVLVGGAGASAAAAAVLLGLLCAVAWCRRLHRSARATAVAVGLLAASAVLLRVADGLPAASFHAFVILALITAYQDWVPVTASAALVALHNLAAGLADPTALSGHPAAAAHPLLWATGHLGVLLLGLALGIAAWRLDERERALARQVLDSTADGIYGRDEHGVITFANDALAQIVGREVAELVGRRDHDALGHAAEGGPAHPATGCPACAAIGAMTGSSSDGALLRRGEAVPIEYTATPLRDRGNVVGAVVTVRDRSETDSLARRALHDALTGLPNRVLLDERLRQALVRVERSDGALAVLFLDLDRFKVINDSLGHAVGDELLVTTARRLQEAVRTNDTVARFGGDEFVIVCEDFHDERDVVRICERLVSAITRPLELDGKELAVTTSIGIAMTRERDASPDSLLRDADAAMYRAKELGRNRYELFDESLRQQAVARFTVESDLRHALARSELVLHYQPNISLETGRLLGVEALLRWEHPERGQLPPGMFIPVAEETGMIVPIGAWVLEQACSTVQRWRQQPGQAHLRLSVNLSGRQLADPDLVGTVADVLHRTGFPAALLCLEITESVLMDDTASTLRALRGLKRLGVTLAVDDFGTGYSSLAYLTRFPIDALKVDRSFVAALDLAAESWPVVSAVVGLSRSLGLECVAEGVEEAHQAQVLRTLGCGQAQGFHFARPQPPEALEQMLADAGRFVVQPVPAPVREVALPE